MNTQDTKRKDPGPNDRGGLSFGVKPGRGGHEGRDGRGGRDRRGGAGASASFRIVTELSTVEKALTKLDFAAMKAPLEEILRVLRPLHLASVEDLDLNTRGKLITSLMRVLRAPKPKPAASGEASAQAAAEVAPAEAAPPGGGEAKAAEAAPVQTPEGAAPAPEEPAKPEVDPAIAAWSDAIFTVGLIWRAVNAVERAEAAFAAAGRQPTEADLAAPPPPSDRHGKDPHGEKGARGERPVRGQRRKREDARTPFTPSGDWQADAQRLEEMGRTRDAGRLHEKHQSFAQAARLFELGGDLKAALRNAALGKLDEVVTALSAKLKPEDVIDALQRAQAWDRLMEFHLARNDFGAMARLYERARQFDQAGLAWERAGKLSLARKAYERAKDLAAANRVRELEVTRLVERGDKLGAAALLVGAGRTADALELLKSLPGPKAYLFMEKLKLKDEAKAFAQAELQKAEAGNDVPQKARWLELLGNLRGAAETWLAVDRKDRAAYVFERLGDLTQAARLFEAAGQLDKAQALYEKLGDTANAERVKALPRPERKPRPGRAEASVLAAAVEMPPPAEAGSGASA